MRLEHLALWEERYLFTEQGEPEKGFIGWFKGYFDEDRLVFPDMVMLGEADEMIRYELNSLCMFLVSESAGYMLRTLSDMTAFCRDKLHDHIPYSFNRECWGFRILTDEYAWYIALTPWNDKRQLSVYCYDRHKLMSYLAKQKGLPEYCYGILKYTGERMIIRYGEDGYESFPQYGGNATENRKYAAEQNKALKVTDEQVAAMEKGVIFGWDTIVADPHNYDENGYFCVPENATKGRRSCALTQRQSN